MKSNNMKKKIATGILIGASIGGVASSTVLAANTSNLVDDEVVNTVEQSVKTSTKSRSKRSTEDESLPDIPAIPDVKLVNTKMLFESYIPAHGPNTFGYYQKFERPGFQEFYHRSLNRVYYGCVTDFDNTTFKTFIGLFNYNGKLYYADDYGNIKTGLQTINGNTYYFGTNKKDAYARREWVRIGDKEYYFGQNGIALKGFVNVDGIEFYFNKKGEMVKEMRITDEGELYYYVIGNKYPSYGWRKVDEDYFYFDKENGGRAVKNTVKEISGVMHEFDKYGRRKGMWKVGV